MSKRRFTRYSKMNPVGALKPPFKAFNPHTYESPVLRNENMIITSIDPGIVNCGVYVNCLNTKTNVKKSLYLARLEFNKTAEHYTESIRKFEELEEKHSYFSSHSIQHVLLLHLRVKIKYQV